jgi:hypothetical protein
MEYAGAGQGAHQSAADFSSCFWIAKPAKSIALLTSLIIVRVQEWTAGTPMSEGVRVAGQTQMPMAPCERKTRFKLKKD